MAFIKNFTSLRTTVVDPADLNLKLKALDATAVAYNRLGTQIYTVEKSTTWTTPQTTSAQNAIDTAAALTMQRQAQNTIDTWAIEYRALVLALVDQINVLRAAANPVLPAITPTQAIAAIRTKAGTL